MKALVNDNCIGCGICEGICPQVFQLNSDNKSQAVQCPIEKDNYTTAKDAEENCPVDAISIIDA